VLVSSRGLTLYRNTAEKGGKIACTGSCAKEWPPLLAGSRSPQAGTGVTGDLGTVKRPDGTVQVTDNGWPLYRYHKDTDAEDAYGQGVEGIWFAASAKNTPKAASGSSSSSSSGGKGYGSGY
jgi:predicted lipoprotein with Yx(FWY)xxD motif